MDLASFYYLGSTLMLFAIFVLIVARTYNCRRKDQGEAPKYRMMDED